MIFICLWNYFYLVNLLASASSCIVEYSNKTLSNQIKSKYVQTKCSILFFLQRRQLRASHPDVHFCAAQYKYMRELAVRFRASTNFFCMDDKAKVPFGEPGTSMSSGVRGKKTLAPSTTTLVAADHDQLSKGSLTPSVSLQVEIPDNISKSFYRGQVTVEVQDAVFQPSSPMRHAASLRPLLQEDPKPILILFTDGGPDHRLTYESVKVSLIALFKATNLDMIIAGRCAPGQSWMNPVERVMALLNLGLQNVSLEREAADVATEGMSEVFQHPKI